MIKNISVLYVLIFAISCKERQSESNLKSGEINNNNSYITKVVTLNSPGDTSNIEFEYAGYSFKMYYSKNKPQFIVVKNNLGANNKPMNHYAAENKGLYITSFDSSSVSAFGVKYLNGHNGIDVILNPADGTPKFFNQWEEYTNDGLKYDFSEVYKGKLKVYQYKDGEVVDSFYMTRQNK